MQVLDRGVALQAVDVLKGVLTNGTGRRYPLNVPAAGKTGTQVNNTNAWFVGFTPELTTAVWVGDPDAYTPMVNVPEFDQERVQGGLYPTQIWQQYMNNAHAFLPGNDWEAPPAARPAAAAVPARQRVHLRHHRLQHGRRPERHGAAGGARTARRLRQPRGTADDGAARNHRAAAGGTARHGAGAGVQPRRFGHDDPAERARPARPDQHRSARLPDRCVLSDDLLELQRIDSAIDQLAHRRANLPERAAAETASAELARTTGQIAALIARQRQLNDAIEEAEQTGAELTRKRERLQGQLRTVSSPREAEALMHELDSLATRRDELDDAELANLEEQSQVVDDLAAAHRAEVELAADAERSTADLAAAEAAIDAADRRATRCSAPKR